MFMKELVARVSDELKKLNEEDLQQADPYQSILNKVCLTTLNAICKKYANSNEPVTFGDTNPFIHFLIETNELISRLAKAKLLPVRSHLILISNYLREIVAKALATASGREMYHFLKMQRVDVAERIVPLYTMDVLASLLLEELQKVPLDDQMKMNKKALLASELIIEKWQKFLTERLNDKNGFSRKEYERAISNCLEIWKHVGGSIADIDNGYDLRSNKFMKILATYYHFGDAAAALTYRNFDVKKMLKGNDVGDGPLGANKRLLDYISDNSRLREIKLNYSVTTSRFRGLSEYDFSLIKKNNLTKDHLNNSLVLFAVGRLYINDREPKQGLLSIPEKVPAAYWALEYFMSQKKLADFERNIPDAFKQVFKNGELKKLKELVLDAAKLEEGLVLDTAMKKTA